jgi:uncharacterized protein YndB with AHSA1/START domain
MRGTLSPADGGRLVLRFERRLAHPPEQVWRALTSMRGLQAWFPVEVLEFDATPGARLRFDLTAEAKRRMDIPADADTASEGTITAADPPKLLEYAWAGEVLRWELTPDGAGCVLVFTDEFDAQGEAAEIRAGWSLDMATGWHVSLDVLDAHLSDEVPDWSVWDRAEELKGFYPG